MKVFGDLVESCNSVINNDPPSLVFFLEREFADLVVLQHYRCSLTIVPAFCQNQLKFQINRTVELEDAVT